MVSQSADKSTPSTDAPAGMKLHFHIGPHTQFPSPMRQFLLINSGLLHSHDHTLVAAGRMVSGAGRAFTRGRAMRAARLLGNEMLQWQEGGFQQIFLQCDNYMGEMLGRRGVREIYPSLATNLVQLEEQAQQIGADIRFYVSLPEPKKWLNIIYRRNLEMRSDYASFNEFADAEMQKFTWDEVLAPANQALSQPIISVPYQDSYTKNGRAFLAAAGLPEALIGNSRALPPDRKPASRVAMQKINRGQQKLRENSAHWLAGGKSEKQRWFHLPWPAKLPMLAATTDTKRPLQPKSKNLLPPVDCDLAALKEKIIEPIAQKETDLKRSNIADHAFKLRRGMVGQSELALTLALAISYLRRNTPHTDHARQIFLRIWSEEGEYLCQTLNTRWLISSLHSFADFGENEGQRIIGATGFFYGNMIKAYENERGLFGQAPDADYPTSQPTGAEAAGISQKFGVCGTDLYQNINIMAYKLCAEDPVAGQVLEELLLRVSRTNTVFSRYDNNRFTHNIHIKPAMQSWAFGVKPEQDDME